MNVTSHQKFKDTASLLMMFMAMTRVSEQLISIHYPLKLIKTTRHLTRPDNLKQAKRNQSNPN